MFAELYPGFDKKAGIVMNGPFDDPADNQRRKPFAVAYDCVEGFYREVFDEWNPFEYIAQLVEQRFYEFQQFGLSVGGNGFVYHDNMSFDNRLESIFIGTPTLCGDFCGFDELVGYASQSWYNDNDRLLAIFNYLFDIRHTRYRAYRCPSEFQYFHICIILSVLLSLQF